MRPVLFAFTLSLIILLLVKNSLCATDEDDYSISSESTDMRMPLPWRSFLLHDVKHRTNDLLVVNESSKRDNVPEKQIETRNNDRLVFNENSKRDNVLKENIETRNFIAAEGNLNLRKSRMLTKKGIISRRI
uniref:Uncharacterized protein n=1 Tax=Cacopsylla melanoneura TaxID=428564 RepID=A0A8D9E9L5_9HEMI